MPLKPDKIVSDNAFQQSQGRIEEYIQDSLRDPSHREEVRLQLRGKANESHWFFCRFVCEYPDVETSVHLDMCERWQARLARRFQIYLLPRSHLKTSLFTVGGTLWETVRPRTPQAGNKWSRGKDLRHIIFGGTLSKAGAILKEIKHIVLANDMFAWLYPEFVPDDRWRAGKGKGVWLQERIDFPCADRRAGRKEGNIEIAAQGASRTGYHYDIQTYDDIVHEENVLNPDVRKGVYDWVLNTYQLRDNPINSRIRLIGTRWHHADCYGELIRGEKKWRESGKPPSWLVYRRNAREGADKQPIWHERFTVAALEEIKDQIGSYFYSCQYENNPIAEEDAIFVGDNLQEIEEFEIPTEVISVVAIDLADEESTRGDFSVLTAASMDSEGNFYIREVQRGKYSTEEMLARADRLCRKYHAVKCGIETVGFQKTLLRIYRQKTAELRLQIPWVEMERGKSSKIRRALGLQPRTERGQFFYSAALKEKDALVEEMVQFPMGAHDDIVDTVVDCEAICVQPQGEFIQPNFVPNSLNHMFGGIGQLEANLSETARLNR